MFFSTIYHTIFTLLCLLGITAVVSLFMTRWMLSLLPQWGLIDKPDFRRHIHVVAVPRGGGIGIFVVFCIVIISFFGFCGNIQSGKIFRFLRFLYPMGILFPLGILDDKYTLRPRTKFFFQIAAGVLTWHMHFRLGGCFGYVFPPWLCFLVTVFWVVAFINAFNMIDGVDGLASGIGFISSICMIVIAIVQKQNNFAAVLVIFAGSLLGFLYYNWHPAKLFMGDTGSMFIGYMLAVSGLRLNAQISSVTSICIPLLACGIPIVDISLAVWRRLLGPANPGKQSNSATEDQKPKTFLSRCARLLARLGTADQKHLHHRMLILYRNNQRKTVWSIYILATIMGGVGILCCFLPNRNLVLALLLILGTFSFIMNRLAFIELWNSTEKLYHDFQSPRAGFFISFVINPILDIFVLFISYFIASRCLGLMFLPCLRYIVMILIILLFSRPYRIYWNFAVSDDYFRLIITLFIGFILAGTTDFFIVGKVLGHLHCYAGSLAIFLMVLGRLFLHYFRNSQARCAYEFGITSSMQVRTLIYGISTLTRYYRNRLQDNVEQAGVEQIIGAVTQSRRFHHSYCFGIRVLGLLRNVPDLVQEKKINKIVLAAPLPPLELERLKKLAAECHITLTQFSCQEEELFSSLQQDKKK